MQYKKNLALCTALSLVVVPLVLSGCGIGPSRGSSLYNGLRPPGNAAVPVPETPAPPPPPPAPAPPPPAKPELTSIYFDVDSSVVKAESEANVSAWAAYLVANPGFKAVVQANTDSRGSKKYNLALGERRATAVVATLIAKGVGVGQLTTASFGAEKPLAKTEDEAGWALNRRVDILVAP